MKEISQKIPPEVSRITAALDQAGFLAYLVGGCIRDLLLGLEPKDWDVATNAKPDQIISLFPKTVYENAFGTVLVVGEKMDVEVTPFRLESKYSDKRHPDEVKFSERIGDDLKRRDFTINALAYETKSGQLIDLYDGLKDLKDKTIRAVGNPEERFAEDALRLLRAIRFASQLGFTIETETIAAIQAQSELMRYVAAERIKDEFTKIIESDSPMVGLIMAQKLGILAKFLPELEEGIHVKQTKQHKYDVWEHSLRVLQHAADKKYGLEVRLACLFHDIGKPRTRRFDREKGDNTFYGHEVVGAKMAQQIMLRLKFLKKQTEIVAKLVRNHMFFSDIEQITLSAVRRIIANVGREHIWQLMEVRMCDRIGMGRPKEEPYRLRKYESMIEEALRAPTSVSMLKIDGNDVSREAGIAPGPKIGFILHALLEEVLDNPELNAPESLIKRSKELAALPDAELRQLGVSGKEKKEEVEAEEIKKIRAKFHVK